MGIMMNYVLMAVNLGVLSHSALRWPDCHRLFAYLSSSSGPKILYLEHKADGTTVCACPWARLLLSFSVEDNWKPRGDREISMCLRAHLWCGHFFSPIFCTQKLLSAQFNASSRDSIKALFPIVLKSKIANSSFSQSWLPEKQANNKKEKSTS